MRRLVEDPQVPAGLRNRLLRSQAAGQDYEMAAKLAQLRSALSDPSRQPLGEPSRLASPSQPRVQRREVAQIIRMRALLKGDPAAAYELGQQAQREFPRGVLIEEREALSIVALAKSGSRDAAERRARAFVISFPDSPLREFVEAGLKP